MARAVVALNGIIQLWETENYQDCWVLYRCMLDRLFHLNDLIVKDEFELFERWSFQQQYNARNRTRSDVRLNGRLDREFFADSQEEKDRNRDLSKDRPEWKRPFPEEVAKRMGMDFLFKQGYDFASTLVHPMANDGQWDYARLLELNGKDEQPDQMSVVHNSCLVAFMIVQQAMTAHRMRWLNLVVDLFKAVGEFFNDGNEGYKVSFARVAQLGPEFRLCEPKESNDP